MKNVKILTMYILATLMTLFICFTSIFVSNLVVKKYFGLGDPVVYDAHSLWGFSPRPNRQYKRLDGNIVSINNVGTRGKQEWREDGANILFLGDSITYGGSYINDNETFVHISCLSISNWSCHNAGVNAYGILNMVARSRYDSRINDAPIRVFTFYSGDFDRGLKNSNTAHFILRDPPTYLNGLWELLNFIAAKVNPKSWFGKRSDIKNKELIQLSKIATRQFALDIFITELKRLETIGAKFIIVHSPSVSELNNPNLILENFVLVKLQEKFPDKYISLETALKVHYKNKNEGIYKDSTHYEKRGHKIVGDFLAPIITQLTN